MNVAILPKPMPEPHLTTAAAYWVIATAMGIPITALTVINPAPDSFTLVGAALAVFCIVSYMKSKGGDDTGKPLGNYTILFNVLATGACGWMLPEVVAQYVLRVNELGNKAWMALAFLIGLAGGALVTAFIVIFRARIPAAVSKAADRILPHTEDKKP